ncbi:MAG: DNA adenine methylase [Methanoregulaceae archaeon PtaU1.Bin222]|nr:MAG: DNA adenine methylase [Methanoregulaceae archaeon PtaU1.Bin222]
MGGGAVFFRKTKAKAEVVNDVNSELINFYRVVQTDFVSLEKEIVITLHSRDLHRKARVIYENPDMFDPLKRAWAVWVLASQSFGSMLDGSFGYDRSGSTSRTVKNKRNSFTLEYAERLQDVEIECADALRIIRSRDSARSFFYCDPPYYQADMGHYDGYTKEDFEMLLQTLAGIEGKFLLSSYPSDLLEIYREKHGWNHLSLTMALSMGGNPKDGKKRMKHEVLTANYPIELTGN